MKSSTVCFFATFDSCTFLGGKYECKFGLSPRGMSQQIGGLEDHPTVDLAPDL